MKGTRIALAAAMVFLSAIVLFSGFALAGSHCQRVHGTGLTFQVFPLGPFAGSAELNLGEAAVFVLPQGPPDVKPDGTLHVVTSHLFDFVDDGGFVTTDKGVLAPTETPGLFNLNTRAKVCATPECADEVVAGAAPCGRLSIHGTINFAVFPAEAEWRVKGKICDCGGD